MDSGAIIVIVFGAFAALCATLGCVSWIARKRIQAKIAEELEPLLERVLSCATISQEQCLQPNLRVLEGRLKAWGKNLRGLLTVIQDHRGNAVNVCPECGDTLTVESTPWRSRILICPNYPKCRYLINAGQAKRGEFLQLRVTDLERGV